MLKSIIFWGACGHAKVLREFIGGSGYELVALFDNQAGVSPPFADVPLYCGQQGFKDWRSKHTKQPVACLVAIGGAKGQDRLEIQNFLAAQSLIPIVAVHPTAFVAASVTVGKGSQILAQTAVAAEVQMGEVCIINTSASVDHECVLGDGVHVAPGAVLAGCIRVGDFSLIGTGAVVLPRITIGKNVIIGAGAVVTKDVPDNKVVFGNPARIMRERGE
jgi:sugar O-acyltransferase (sialic acid O-acetyltransferase NeuD family)